MTDLTGLRCVVVGYGSIGARHARILQELGCNVAVVSRRVLFGIDTFTSIAEAIRQHEPSYVVIANETALHYDALRQLVDSGYQGRVLMEKPLFESVRDLPSHNFRSLNIAYNLRFHPVIVRLKALLVGQEILSVQAYVGQYLPDWRPEADYRRSYSAQAAMGGGVLLDLSHDLDYLIWMFGDWLKVAALGGQLSSLELTSDDIFTLLLSFSRCPIASIQLNYLDRCGRRQLLVNTTDHTFEVDFIKNKIVVDRVDEVFSVERDDTYREMHMELLRGQSGSACTIDEALSTLHLIESVRRAAENSEWVIK